MFAGSLNNWQYAPMYKIEDFLMMLDSGFTDPLQDMLDNGLIGGPSSRFRIIKMSNNTLCRNFWNIVFGPRISLGNGLASGFSKSANH